MADNPKKDDEGSGKDDDELAELKSAIAAERKSNRDLRRELAAAKAELDDRKGDEDRKSDGDSERIAKLERDLSAERLARLRLEVAGEKGLTPAQAKRLAGSTRDELAADADEILEAFPVKTDKAKTDEGDDDDAGAADKGGRGNGATTTLGTSTERRPRENLKGGGKAEQTPEETDPRKLAEAIPRV